MKTFKHCTRFLCILALMYSLTNCQDDSVADFSSPENTEAKSFPYVTTLISDAEVNGNTLLTTQMRNLQTLQRSGFAENDDSDLYDFTVDTDVVKFIENTENDSHSYTFSISRENAQTTNLENVVFSYNTQTNDYDASLVTYYLSTAQLQEFLQHDHISTSYQLTSVPLALDFTSVMGEMDMITPCTTHFTVYHITPDTNETFLFSSTDGNIQNTCEHESDDDPCETYTVVTYEDCPDGGSSSGSGSGATGGTAGGSTTGNDSGSDGMNDSGDDSYNDIITSPIAKDEMQQIADMMNEVVGEGNWVVNENEEPSEDAPVLESTEDLQEFFDNLSDGNFEFDSSDEVDDDNNNIWEHHKMVFSESVGTYIKASVKRKVYPSGTLTTMQVSDILGVRTRIIGSTTIFNWTQLDDEDVSNLSSSPSIEVDPDTNSILIKVNAEMEINTSSFGRSITTVRSIIVELNYDPFTRELHPHYSHWYYDDLDD